MQIKISKQGFTLIELLVVIAIIGLLASIVLVSFPTATAKAKDAKIISAVGQLRNLAAEYYTTSNTYTGYSMNVALTDSITKQGGSAALFINTAAGPNYGIGQAYCIVTALVTSGAGFYCADGTGVIGKTTTNTTCVTDCQAAGTCLCPSGTSL